MDGTNLEDFEPPVEVRVARTLDDIQRIAVVRALVYMSEQDCPYDEEFDGNDLAGATHLIAEAGGEPLGCLRLRWFSDFAKVERVCVREAPPLRQAPRAPCSRPKRPRSSAGKAIPAISARCRPSWCHIGNDTALYIARSAANSSSPTGPTRRWRRAIEPHPDALTDETDPLVLDRPEGDWDTAGTAGVDP
jgi:hypothetical protein